MNKKIIIAGGTGFLGQVIINHLRDRFYDFIVLSRSKHGYVDGVKYLKWDGESIGSWAKELEKCYTVINLTGKSVNCRYNRKNKRIILESRVNATRALGKAIKECSVPPAVWINTASATIYRHSIDKEMDEYTGEIGSGFSVDVCNAWEKEFNQVTTPNTRKVCLRTSMVLGKAGGVLPVMHNLARVGLGGKQGSGEQFVSWIHEEDFVRSIEWIIDKPHLAGTFNCTAPVPITNAEFTTEIRKRSGRKFGLNASKWMLEAGAVIMRTESELILKSRRVIPTRISESGFQFRFPTIEHALNNLL